MNRISKLLVVVVSLAAAASADSAFAKHGRKSARVRSSVAADATSTAARAKLAIRMREDVSGRWELVLQLRRAPSGLAPQAFIADATGTLTLAGDLAASHESSGEYKLRLRGSDATTLPLGAAKLADLSGRAFEVRDSGVALVAGTMPTLASVDSATSTGGSTGGADDPATHDATDDNGTDAAGHDANDDSASAGTSSSTSTSSGADDSSGHGRHGGHGSSHR